MQGTVGVEQRIAPDKLGHVQKSHSWVPPRDYAERLQHDCPQLYRGRPLNPQPRGLLLWDGPRAVAAADSRRRTHPHHQRQLTIYARDGTCRRTSPRMGGCWCALMRLCPRTSHLKTHFRFTFCHQTCSAMNADVGTRCRGLFVSTHEVVTRHHHHHPSAAGPGPSTLRERRWLACRGGKKCRLRRRRALGRPATATRARRRTTTARTAPEGRGRTPALAPRSTHTGRARHSW
mmetsp:Transcript_13960/g.35935  ORF Transcript_13960/g.35935 Transcript_13960/m.35935 type:complete len:233 (+) Transcript_13960:1259-1957(+)